MIPQHPAPDAGIIDDRDAGGHPAAGPDDGPPDVTDGGAAGSGLQEADTAAPRSGARALQLVCIALFLLSVLLAALAAVQSSRLHKERGDRQAVREVAGRFVTALLTYDYRSLDTAKQRVLAFAAGNFRDTYEQAYKGGLDVLLTQTKGHSEVTVTHIYVGDLSGDQADVIVAYNQTTSGVAGSRSLLEQYVELNMVRVSGHWKIDGSTNITDVAPARPASSGTPATTTPTTTK